MKLENILKGLLVGSLVFVGVALLLSPKTPIKDAVLGGGEGFNVIQAPTISTATALTSSPVLVVARNDRRQYAHIQNNGTSTVYIYLGNFASGVAASTTVLPNTGIGLAGAGSYELVPENMYIGDVWVATSSNPNVIMVTEK